MKNSRSNERISKEIRENCRRGEVRRGHGGGGSREEGMRGT